jgi:hypothetical protein
VRTNTQDFVLGYRSAAFQAESALETRTTVGSPLDAGNKVTAWKNTVGQANSGTHRWAFDVGPLTWPLPKGEREQLGGAVCGRPSEPPAKKDATPFGEPQGRATRILDASGEPAGASAENDWGEEREKE